MKKKKTFIESKKLPWLLELVSSPLGACCWRSWASVLVWALVPQVPLSHQVGQAHSVSVVQAKLGSWRNVASCSTGSTLIWACKCSGLWGLNRVGIHETCESHQLLGVAHHICSMSIADLGILADLHRLGHTLRGTLKTGIPAPIHLQLLRWCGIMQGWCVVCLGELSNPTRMIVQARGRAVRIEFILVVLFLRLQMFWTTCTYIYIDIFWRLWTIL